MKTIYIVSSAVSQWNDKSGNNRHANQSKKKDRLSNADRQKIQNYLIQKWKPKRLY